MEYLSSPHENSDHVDHKKVNEEQDQDLPLEVEREKLKFHSAMHDLTKWIPSSRLMLSSLRKWNTTVSKIKSEQQGVDFILNHRPKKFGMIRVQPTSTSRRRPGVNRSKRIPSGRPPKNLRGKYIKKRSRNLILNIKKNQANAKTH